MVTAVMPPCWVSTTARWTKRSPRMTSGVPLGAGAGLALEAGAVPAAWDNFVAGVTAAAGALGDGAAAAGPSEAGVSEADDALGGALDAELLLGFAASPAACLHRSDSESLCSLRQATIRPPPGCTPAHSFCTSDAHAVRASESCGDAVCANDNWGVPGKPEQAIERTAAKTMRRAGHADDVRAGSELSGLKQSFRILGNIDLPSLFWPQLLWPYLAKFGNSLR